MRTRLAVVIGLLSAVAWPAAGAELLLGWDAEVVWDSNVFRTADQTATGDDIPKEDDFSLRTGPDIRVRETQGDLVYDFSYRPRYEEFARLDGIGSLDQFAFGSGRWSIDQRTELSFDDEFGYSSSLGGLFEAVPGTVGTIVVAPSRERITTNTARAGFLRRLGRLWELRLDASHDLYDFKNPANSDATSIGAALSLTRGLTPRLVVGGGVQYQRQEFSGGLSEENDSGTSFYQAFGILTYRISPTWTFSMNAGPAFSKPDDLNQSDTFTIDSRSAFALAGDRATQIQVFTDPQLVSQLLPVGGPGFIGVVPDSCPRRSDGTPVIRVLPQKTSDFCTASLAGGSGSLDVPFTAEQQNDGSLTYYGRMSIEKRWRTWNATASYQRSASSGSGLGTSTTLDLVTGQLRWTPTALWTLTLTGTMSKQSAVNEVRQVEIALQPTFFPIGGGFGIPVGIPFEVTTGDPIDNSVDIRQYHVELRAERRITRNFYVDGTATWWKQITQSGQIDFDRVNYRFVLGFTWNFEPIPL